MNRDFKTYLIKYIDELDIKYMSLKRSRDLEIRYADAKCVEAIDSHIQMIVDKRTIALDDYFELTGERYLLISDADIGDSDVPY